MIFKILKIIIKSKSTFTDIDNENNKGLVHKRNSKHKCYQILCATTKKLAGRSQAKPLQTKHLKGSKL